MTVGEIGSKEELDKVMVEVTGATGVVKIPLSKFVYKSGDTPVPPTPTPVPPKPEDDDNKKKAGGVSKVLVFFIVMFIVVLAGVGFFIWRRNEIAKQHTTHDDTESLDRSGDYSMARKDEDTSHLKRD